MIFKGNHCQSEGGGCDFHIDRLDAVCVCHVTDLNSLNILQTIVWWQQQKCYSHIHSLFLFLTPVFISNDRVLRVRVSPYHASCVSVNFNGGLRCMMSRLRLT